MGAVHANAATRLPCARGARGSRVPAPEVPPPPEPSCATTSAPLYVSRRLPRKPSTGARAGKGTLDASRE